MGAWTRRRIVATVCAGLLIGWLLAVAWALLGARSQLAAGAADLRAVRREASVASLVAPSSRARLASSRRHFRAAASRIGSPVLLPLRVLPVAGRHVRAVERVAETSAAGTEVAADALRDLTELTQRPRGRGPERVATLQALAQLAERTRSRLRALDPGSPDALFGPVGDGVAELRDQRASAERAAVNLRDTSMALAEVLDGPQPYLLLGANNGEMRVGSGMALSAAELRFDHGRLALGEVRPTADLVLPEGAVPATGDLARNWPWLEPGRDLRNVGLTADFPQSARLAVDTWAQVPEGGPVAGVILLDVDGMRSLLRVVGPVEVDGVRYTSDTVRGELLRRQYDRFGDDRSARRDQLGGVARAIFERIEAGDWKLEDLATEVADAVAGRHLLIWSADADHQRAWRAAGADGHLRDRSISIGMANRSGTKLDSWLDATATVATAGRRITVTYRVVSSAPAEGPAYVVGPNARGLEAGDHRGLVVANLPAGTTDVRMAGARVFLQGGDGPTVVVGGEVEVRRGATVTVTVTGVLPSGLTSVVLEPSARIERTRWVVEGRALARDRRRTVELGD